MNRKPISLLLALLMLLLCLTGCDTLGQIAGSVADAAKQELEAQIQAVLEEYKMDVVELRTTAGKLNDEEGDLQFFCAVLVRSDNDAVPQTCADALGKLFEAAGVMPQTGTGIESPYLVHKDLEYQFTGITGSNYYTIYVYSSVALDNLLSTEAETEG